VKRITALLAVLALALAVPASALGQAGPFSPLPPPPPEETATPEPVDNDPTDSEISQETLGIILGAVVLLFVVIGYYITRDARRALPEDRPRIDNLERDEGPHRKPQQAKAKARQKAKAAKKARKVTKRGR